jgi:hypothetical protein
MYDYVEVWESINNDRANAVRVAQVRGDSYETASDTALTRFFWVRAHKIGRGVSAWEPDNPVGGVTASFGGAAAHTVIGALNANPMFSNHDGTPSFFGWTWPDGEAVTLSDGQVGRTAAQIVGFTERPMFSDIVPIDPNDQYRISGWFRQPSGGLRSFLLVACYDGAGNLLDGGTNPGSGWNVGTYHYWGLVDELIPSTFTFYSTTFGPGAERQLPSATRFIKIGGLLPYVTGTPGATTIQAQAYSVVKLTTQVFRQSTAPNHVAGRLWQDTDDGRIYRSDGTVWTQITAADALLLINAPAQAGADVTALNADDVIFRQASAPSTPQVGWLWLDTDDLRFYRFNGSIWQQIGSDDARNLSAGAPAEAGADATAGHALDIVLRQATAPGSPQVGWIWIDTDDLRVYRFDGATWVQIVGLLGAQDLVGTEDMEFGAATEVLQATDAIVSSSASGTTERQYAAVVSVTVDAATDVFEVSASGLSTVMTAASPGGLSWATIDLAYQVNGGGFLNVIGGGFLNRPLNTAAPFAVVGIKTGLTPGDDIDFAIQVEAFENAGSGTVIHTVTNSVQVVTVVKR